MVVSNSTAIPDRLNVLLVIGVQAGAAALLWAGARASPAWAFGLGVAFSFLLLTNYALLHEAAHNHLHSTPAGNAVLGTLAGALFPASLSMVRVTHAIYHCFN